MKMLRRLGLSVAFGLAFAAAPAVAAPLCGSSTPIKFAGITWKSGQFYTELIRTILEDGYGCKTELVTGGTDATQTQLTNNALQVWVELWGGRAEIIKKGLAQGKMQLIGNLLEGGSEEGWYVPSYLIYGDPKHGIKPLAPDLRSVSDLHRYKDLFKNTEDASKANFVNCPEGWDCEKNNDQKLIAYGLTGEFDNYHPSSGAVMDMLVVGRLVSSKPVLFYYWSPAPLMGQFKLVRLQEPAYNEPCWKTIYDPTNKHPCGSATPPTMLQIGVSTQLAASDPEVVEFMSHVKLTPEQINGAIFRMSETAQSAQFEAQYFLKSNPIWQQWVSKAVAAKVHAALN